MRSKYVLAAVAASLMLTACGSGSDSVGPTSPPATSATRPSSTASISIVSPQPGEVVQGSSVPAKLSLEGGTITKVVSTNLKPDEGHIHLKLDGLTITLLGSLEETIPDVTAGPHLLEAEFVAADHGPFDPRVISTVTFTVAA